MAKEIEVFGITYDRYVLMKLHKILARDLDLNSIVEMPSHGAKAAGSLYSKDQSVFLHIRRKALSVTALRG